MEKSKRARRRKPDTAKTDLEPPHRVLLPRCTRDEGRPLGLGPRHGSQHRVRKEPVPLPRSPTPSSAHVPFRSEQGDVPR